MGLLASFREQRRRQGLAERYVAALLRPPAPDDLAWLMQVGGGTAESATVELAFAQRAIGLIVAERDALDDRTAADVSHALDAVVAREARQRQGVAADWAAHWRDYADALASRGRSEAPLRRIARVLLRRAGVADPESAAIDRALEIVTAFRHAANAALRDAYGAASLPEDRPPSALLRERSGHG